MMGEATEVRATDEGAGTSDGAMKGRSEEGNRAVRYCPASSANASTRRR